MIRFNYEKAFERALAMVHFHIQIEEIENGTWPQNSEERNRWSVPAPGYRTTEDGEQVWETWTPESTYLHESKIEVAYLYDVERRLAAGDPTLQNWEGWVQPFPDPVGDPMEDPS